MFITGKKFQARDEKCFPKCSFFAFFPLQYVKHCQVLTEGVARELFEDMLGLPCMDGITAISLLQLITR